MERAFKIFLRKTTLPQKKKKSIYWATWILFVCLALFFFPPFTFGYWRGSVRNYSASYSEWIFWNENSFSSLDFPEIFLGIFEASLLAINVKC